MYPSTQNPAYGTFVKNAEQQLIDHGFAVKKVVLQSRANSKLAKLFNYLSFIARGFITLTKSSKNDIVFIHYASFSGIPVILASLFRQLNLVSNVHGGDIIPCDTFSPMAKKLNRFLSTLTIKRSDRIIVPSRFTKQWMLTHFNVTDSQLFISPSGGIDLDLFKPCEVKTSRTKTTFGYVGRLDPEKGILCLIKAFAKLVIQNPDKDIALHIIGSGKLQLVIEQRIKQLQITARVTLFGALKQNQLPTHYQSFDFLVFPTQATETLGLVGLEAMATATPIIAPNYAGISDYLKVNQNGLSFNAGDEISLLNTMQQALNLPRQNYEQLCQNALATAKQYDSKQVGKSLAECFSQEV